MQKARSHHASMAPTACKRTVSGSISLPYLGFFSPFPHGTSSLSVSQEYLALPDGAGRFPQDFSGPVVLRNPAALRVLRLQGFHLLWPRFPDGFDFDLQITYAGPTTPTEPKLYRLGLVPVRSPLLGESLACFLFLRLLRCFSSPGWPHVLQHDNPTSSDWVDPFGHPRITPYLPVPAVFRSLSRPSSPLRA